MRNNLNYITKHARNNTNVLFDSIGISNYEYVLQSRTRASDEVAEVKVMNAPKYEYYITPKEARENEIQSLYKQS